MISRRTWELVRKAIAATLSAALILTAPGPSVYQAFASEVDGPRVGETPVASPNPVQPIGAIDAPLEINTNLAAGASLSGAGVSVVVPSLIIPGQAPASARNVRLIIPGQAAAPNRPVKIYLPDGSVYQPGASPAATVSGRLEQSVHAIDRAAAAPSSTAGDVKAAVDQAFGEGIPAAPAAVAAASDPAFARDEAAARDSRTALSRPTPRAAKTPSEPPASSVIDRITAAVGSVLKRHEPVRRDLSKEPTLDRAALAEAPAPAPLLPAVTAAQIQTFDQAFKQKAKGGGPVKRVFAFFNSDGSFREGEVLQRPSNGRSKGIALEIVVTDDPAIALDANSSHNAAVRAQFKQQVSRAIPEGGFQRAQAFVAAVSQARVAKAAGAAPQPVLQPQPAEQPQPALQPTRDATDASVEKPAPVPLAPQAAPAAQPAQAKPTAAFAQRAKKVGSFVLGGAATLLGGRVALTAFRILLPSFRSFSPLGGVAGLALTLAWAVAMHKKTGGDNDRFIRDMAITGVVSILAGRLAASFIPAASVFVTPAVAFIISFFLFRPKNAPAPAPVEKPASVPAQPKAAPAAAVPAAPAPVEKPAPAVAAPAVPSSVEKPAPAPAQPEAASAAAVPAAPVTVEKPAPAPAQPKAVPAATVPAALVPVEKPAPDSAPATPTSASVEKPAPGPAAPKATPPVPAQHATPAAKLWAGAKAVASFAVGAVATLLGQRIADTILKTAFPSFWVVQLIASTVAWLATIGWAFNLYDKTGENDDIFIRDMLVTGAAAILASRLVSVVFPGYGIFVAPVVAFILSRFLFQPKKTPAAAALAASATQASVTAQVPAPAPVEKPVPDPASATIPGVGSAAQPVTPAPAPVEKPAPVPAQPVAAPAAAAAKKLNKADWALMTLLVGAGIAAPFLFAPALTFMSVSIGFGVGFSTASLYKDFRTSPTRPTFTQVASALLLLAAGAFVGHWWKGTYYATMIGASVGSGLFSMYWKPRQAREAQLASARQAEAAALAPKTPAAEAAPAVTPEKKVEGSGPAPAAAADNKAQAAPADAPRAPAKPATSPRRVLGVMAGAMLAAAVAPFFGLATPAVAAAIFAAPLLGWVVGGLFEKQAAVSFKDESGSLIGAAAGTAVAAALALFGLPLPFFGLVAVSPAVALTLPALGAGIGHFAQNKSAEALSTVPNLKVGDVLEAVVFVGVATAVVAWLAPAGLPYVAPLNMAAAGLWLLRRRGQNAKSAAKAPLPRVPAKTVDSVMAARSASPEAAAAPKAEEKKAENAAAAAPAVAPKAEEKKAEPAAAAAASAAVAAAAVVDERSLARNQAAYLKTLESQEGRAWADGRPLYMTFDVDGKLAAVSQDRAQTDKKGQTLVLEVERTAEEAFDYERGQFGELRARNQRALERIPQILSAQAQARKAGELSRAADETVPAFERRVKAEGEAAARTALENGAADKAYAKILAALKDLGQYNAEIQRYGVALAITPGGRAALAAAMAAKKTPATYAQLPAEARHFGDNPVFLAHKNHAEELARRVAKDAKLVSVSIGLFEPAPNSHWVFKFESRRTGQLITVYQGGRVVKKKISEHSPALGPDAIDDIVGLKAAYGAMKRVRPGLKPVRVEIVDGPGGAVYVFTGQKGARVVIPGHVSAPVPVPAPAPVPAPDKPAPNPAPAPAPVPNQPAPAPVPAPPAPPTPAPPAQPPDNKGPPQASNHQWLREGGSGPNRLLGFFGWRHVEGIKSPGADGKPLKSLSPNSSSSQIIDQLAAINKVSRARVLEIFAQKAGLTEESPASAWFSVADMMATEHKGAFTRYDGRKYEGGAFGELLRRAWAAAMRRPQSEVKPGSFREAVVGKPYPEGAAGILLRATEIHKHFFGVFVRFPYHLFDMFVLGYFRRNISFEFFHSTENFLDVVRPGLAEKTLESVAARYAARHDGKPKGLVGGAANKLALISERLLGTAAGRTVNRFVIVPFVAPLSMFLRRRLVMALFSAIAMGALGAAAPALIIPIGGHAVNLLGIHLMSATTANAIVSFTGGHLASVPLIGGALSKVVGKALGALLQDLVVGPLLNTLMLSTMLTFPHAVRERLAKAHETEPGWRFAVFHPETAAAIFRTFVSWSFWTSNLKSFFGMMTVGAEIAGIMTYAESVDLGVSMAFDHNATAEHHSFRVFETMGAAVERPGEFRDEHGVLHHNAIPFGGAITWGNVLLYKAQEGLSHWTGHNFNISDSVMHLLRPSSAQQHAQAVVGLAEGQQRQLPGRDNPAGPGPFDPNQDRNGEAAARDRIQKLKDAGLLPREIDASKERIAQLENELVAMDARIKDLRAQSRPLTPAELAEYDRLVAELGGKRDEAYTKDKLAERHDIENPKTDDYAALLELKQLQTYYDGILLPGGQVKPGYVESLQQQEAQLKALRERLLASAQNRQVGRDHGVVPPVDPATLKQITDLIGEIEQLRGDAGGEMANRDSVRGMLALQNKMRNDALRARRDGQKERDFHVALSQVDVVVRASLLLKADLLGEKFVKGEIDKFQQQIKDAQASIVQSQKNLAAAQANAAQVQAWRDKANQDVASDKSLQSTFANDETEAAAAATNFAAFKSDISREIATINARDKGTKGSADALTEYARREALLTQIVQWRTHGGDPNDPNGFWLDKLVSQQKDVEAKLKKAQDGFATLQNPANAANFAFVAIGGVPRTDGEPPYGDKAGLRADLNIRKAYYQGLLTKPDGSGYQDSLDSVLRMLGQKDSHERPPGTVTDDFGDTRPESLPAWRDQLSTDETAAQGRVRSYLAQIDADAAAINAVAGSQIPMLSELSLKDLQTALKTYGDKVTAVHVPGGANPTPAQHQAQMDLVQIADLVPQAADDVVKWSYDDGAITTINDAMAPGGALTLAQQGLSQVVSMVNAVLKDVDKDISWTNNQDNESDTDIYNRKIALMTNAQNGIIPTLQNADAMLSSLIAYQNTSIASAQPNTGDLWKLYDSKTTLMTQTLKLYNTTIPWELASFGGTVGDVAGAHASIKAWRDKIAQYMSPNGFTDANGTKQESIPQFQQDIADRLNADYDGYHPHPARREMLYGEDQPYALAGPTGKIAVYSTERASRVPQINTNDAQINDILTQVETLSKGQYSFQGLRMPVGVTNDAAGVAQVQRVVDAHTINKLADLIKQIGNDAQSKAGSLSIPTSSDPIPKGTQPPITATTMQQIALMCVDAGKRLVPTEFNAPNPAQGDATYAIARFLYSDSVVNAANDALHNQVPAAETFLTEAATVLNATIESTKLDDQYIDSPTPDPSAVYARQIAVFQNLDKMLKDGNTFLNLKIGWDKAPNNAGGTIDKIAQYYQSLEDIYNGSITANQNIITADQKVLDGLNAKLTTIEKDKVKLQTWLAQLNDPHDPAMQRTMEAVSAMQEQTRRVLEENIKWHDLDDQLARSNDILKSDFSQIDDKQAELSRILADHNLQDALPPDVVARIDKLRIGSGMWDQNVGGDGEAIVVRKSQFNAFVDTVFSAFKAQNPTQDLNALKADILQHPQNLASLLPEASVIDFGDTADGFYLVYQTKFSVPNGLETSSWVTLGNVAKLWGNNISVTGYAFASPPEDTNAPYGDRGVEVQVESLQGRNWVNYLNIDFHRFAFDIPANDQAISQVRESRVMLFDDYAVMMFGGKLYVGLAGFADAAVDQPAAHPYYYGESFKTSLQLTEVMKLNAEQQAMWAKDPEYFLQQISINGYDPYVDGTIYAKGDNRVYHREQIGPQINLGRLLANMTGNKPSSDAFTMDLYWASTGGTDPINQQSLGASILKGFTLKDKSGKPWAVITNKSTFEAGQKFDSLKDRLSVTLPNYGIVVSGQGQIMGNARAVYGEIAKQMGPNSTLAISYGSPVVGMKNRLALSMNSTFTLGQMWESVVGGAKHNLEGGRALQGYTRLQDDFFKADPNDKRVQELKRVWEQDVMRKLLTQDIGALSRHVEDARKAGAIMDNTRMRGMVGWVSNGVSNDIADRSAGGGVQVGVQTDITLKKTPKAEIDADLAALAVDGVKLQGDMIDMVEKWQQLVVEMAQAQWELKADQYMIQAAGTPPALRQQAEVNAARAEDNFHQALLSYNILTGRNPTDPMPFDNLTPADIDALTAEIRKTIAAPDRMQTMLHALDPDELRQQMGDNPRNLADSLPIVDQFTLGIGARLPVDLMANQIFGVGGSIRLPLYDPRSKLADKAYRLESQAAGQQILQAFAEQRLRAQQHQGEARIWQQSADAVRPGLPIAAERLGLAIRAYRNGLIGPSELREAYDSWYWYMTTTLHANGRAAISQAWAALDQGFGGQSPAPAGGRAFHNFNDAMNFVRSQNHGLAEIALRAQAAQEMTLANGHRIQKAFVDLHVGANLTASGTGWLPSIGLTGFPITPILGFEFKPEELRELEVHRDQSQAEYYKQLQTKVETNLAVQFAQNVVDGQLAERAIQLYDTQVIPRLTMELAQARQSGGDAAAAQQRLDEARAQRDQVALSGQQAKGTINFLLGLPADAPLSLQDINPDDMMASLRSYLAAQKPVETQRKLLDSRVAVARAVETMADKDLKVEQLAVEPISLTVRSLGRLIEALGGDHIGNPDIVAAARVQTLTEERARESFDAEIKAATSRDRAELASVESQLARLGSAQTPEAQLARLSLQQRAYGLRAALLSMGDDGNAPASGYDAVPLSFAELQNRLEQKERDASTQVPQAPVELLDPGKLEHQASGFYRYYYAHETLGKEKINQGFNEGWVEVRLKSAETPPEVLLALAKLRQEKADRIYRTQLSGAEAQADILSADFKADVQMLRWARRATANPGGPLKGSLDEFERQIGQRLTLERDELVARLNLSPDTTLEQLKALVPEDPSGSSDLPAMADRFLAQVRALQVGRIRQTLFDGGLPPSFGSEDNLISQLRANTIAERMSYKGFTPVAAFGMFRGQQVSGLFLEAPDPRSIQAGLENVITDALRKELVSTGRMQELTLKLHSLMSRVEDGSHELEKRKDLVVASENEYRALMGRARTPQDMAEAERARQRVVDAWLGFSQQMTQTKADFIDLVTELEALGSDKNGGLRPFVPPVDADFSGLQRDSKAELLSYWADRFRDYSFDQNAVLDSFDRPIPDALRQKLNDDAAAYRLALWNADLIRHKDFSDAEKLNLLSRTDVEGRRLALTADLDALLKAVGPMDPQAGGDGPKLLQFLRQDLEARAAKAGSDRAEFSRLSTIMRDAFWKGVQAAPEKDKTADHFGYESAYERLETKAKALDAERQKLLERYLIEVDGDPTQFILKDVDLDAYLKAQQDFDQELIKTLQMPQARQNRQMALTLDALYGVRGTLDRAAAQIRSGRGMAALDALIMLESARLAAARWDMRPPAEIDAIAQALESLKSTRERWWNKSTDLAPLYAVTSVEKDGQRQWTVDGWMTQQEVTDALAAGTIVARDGKYFMTVKQGDKTVEKEVVGGVDIADARHKEAAARLQDNQGRLALRDRLDKFDFALEKPAKDGSEGYSLDQVFGDGGLHSQGRVFFFEAPQPGEPAGRLHAQLNPLQALALPPEKYVMLIYDGSSPLSRDRFPTLESLRASDDSKDFLRMTMSAKGADGLLAQAESHRAAQLGEGWVDVKLNGYGFALDKKGGTPVQVFTTEDDFKAMIKAFHNADRDLATARAELAAAQQLEARLKDDADQKKADMQRAGLEYQNLEAKLRADLLPQVKARVARQPGETQQVYEARLKIELDKEVNQNETFKAAQKKFEPFTKAFNEADARLKDAHAKTINADKAVADAQTILERSKTWNLYESDQLQLGLDGDGAVVSVAGIPVYGSRALNDRVRDGSAKLNVAGHIYGGEPDAQGRLKKFWTDKNAFERAMDGFKLKSVVMQGEDDQVSADGRTYKPFYRLSHYEDPETGLAVAVSRTFMIDRVKDADSHLGGAKRWGVTPWRWGSLAMELPRGVIGTPMELLTGRDPRQEHYLGRVYMYKTEGGDTEHHGFFQKVADVVDVLNLLPDPVGRYYDPSQFPDTVQVNSTVRPGQNIFDKNLRAGSKDIHYGTQGIQRVLTQSLEDLTTARERTLSHFHGGVEETLIESIRGRAGNYEQSRVTARNGEDALTKGLSDPLVANAPGSDAGGVVTANARPGNLAVNKVQRQILVRPGADQFGQQATALNGYAGRIRASGQGAADDQARLQAELAIADGNLTAASRDRDKAVGDADSLWQKLHVLSWRLGRQRALERELAAAQSEREATAGRLAWWREYLRRLREALGVVRPNPNPDPNPNPQPTPLPSPVDSPFWPWVLVTFGLAAAAAALAHWLRRRRPPLPAPAP